jgi:hypothetical protein
MVLARCNLPASLHAIVAGLAHHTGRSFSQTVVELVERGLSAPVHVGESGAAYRIDDQTGLPVSKGPRIITPQDIARLEDEV